MATKFTLRLRGPVFASAYKALALSALYLLMVEADFKGIFLALFLIGGVVCYLTPVFNIGSVPFAAGILLFAAAFATPPLLPVASPFILAIIFGILFYIALGIKNVAFLHREVWYHILYAGITYSALLTFFLAEHSESFFLHIVGITVTHWLILREFLKLGMPEGNAQLRRGVAACYALIAAELTWGAALLPLGFLNAANLIGLFLFLLGESFIEHYRGSISRYSLLVKITLGITLALIIFATSSWGI